MFYPYEGYRSFKILTEQRKRHVRYHPSLSPLFILVPALPDSQVVVVVYSIGG